MSTTDQVGPATDADAPFGRRPDGTPYKRDPGPFAHLRGLPFGANRTGVGPSAPKPRGDAKAPSKPTKRATIAGPPLLDAAGYATKFTTGFRSLAKMLSKRAPVPAAIVAVRSTDMAEAWGRVAISYPKFGRFIDRASKGGDLSEAIGSTAITLAMLAHVGGYTKGTFMEDILEDAVLTALQEFETGDEFGGMRERIERRMLQAKREAQATGNGGE